MRRKVKKAKIRNRYNQVPHHYRDIKNTMKNHTNERQEVSPFPASDHKAAGNRHDGKIETNVKHKNKKDPQKKHRLGTVSNPPSPPKSSSSTTQFDGWCHTAISKSSSNEDLHARRLSVSNIFNPICDQCTCMSSVNFIQYEQVRWGLRSFGILQASMIIM